MVTHSVLASSVNSCLPPSTRVAFCRHPATAASNTGKVNDSRESIFLYSTACMVFGAYLTFKSAPFRDGRVWPTARARGIVARVGHPRSGSHGECISRRGHLIHARYDPAVRP